MGTNLQRQRVYIRGYSSLFPSTVYPSPVAGNCYNQNSENCGCKVICFLLQELKSNFSERYQRVGLGLCRSPETTGWSPRVFLTSLVLSSLVLSSLSSFLNTKYSWIDIKDRKNVFPYISFLRCLFSSSCKKCFNSIYFMQEFCILLCLSTKWFWNHCHDISYFKDYFKIES